MANRNLGPGPSTIRQQDGKKVSRNTGVEAVLKLSTSPFKAKRH